MFLQSVNQFSFESFRIDDSVNERGQFELAFNSDLPLRIFLYSFFPVENAYRSNWHQRLELFVPVAGEGQFRMGSQVVSFFPGDVVVVDNLKFHGLVDFLGSQRRAVDITFLPELIYTLGSPLCDYRFLTPFFCRLPDTEPVLRANDRLARPVHAALSKMLSCYFGSPSGQQFEAGCKVYLLEVLYYLALHFCSDQLAQAEYLRRKSHSERLGKLFSYLKDNYSENVRISDAAAIVAMSESAFMRYFKQATGKTFGSYLLHVRLNNARRMLEETDLPISQIAARVGFKDHGYFSRKFRASLGLSPREVRVHKRSSS